jgi:hypothetical protein
VWPGHRTQYCGRVGASDSPYSVGYELATEERGSNSLGWCLLICEEEKVRLAVVKGTVVVRRRSYYLAPIDGIDKGVFLTGESATRDDQRLGSSSVRSGRWREAIKTKGHPECIRGNHIGGERHMTDPRIQTALNRGQ